MSTREQIVKPEQQIEKLGLKVSRPTNITTPNDSLESLAAAIEERNHQTEDYVLNRIFEYFDNNEHIGNIEIDILLDGSLVFYVNLLEKMKLNPALEKYFERIHFRFVFKAGNGGMVTQSTLSKSYTADMMIPIDDIWDTGRTAGLPLAKQLDVENIDLYAYSRKESSPEKVEDEESENSATLAVPDSELVLFPDEWVFGNSGMNSNKYKYDWRINMYERINAIPLTEKDSGSFSTDNRDEYLDLIQKLTSPRHRSVKVMIFHRLEHAESKVDEMLKIHNELVNGTNLPKFSTIEA